MIDTIFDRVESLHHFSTFSIFQTSILCHEKITLQIDVQTCNQRNYPQWWVATVTTESRVHGTAYLNFQMRSEDLRGRP
jgi:hypothetical protein